MFNVSLYGVYLKYIYLKMNSLFIKIHVREAMIYKKCLFKVNKTAVL